MLTLFTVPKPFEGHIGVIQRNALESWKRLEPACEILLLGDEDGVAEVAEELGCRHLPGVECNDHGTPMLPDVFARAEEASETEWMGYINTDIVLLDDFCVAVQHLQNWAQKALMVGRRTDVAVYDPLRFEQEFWESCNWQERLRLEADWHGTLREATALDYFVFPKELYPLIPDFAIGRFSFDNWLVYDPLSRGIPVVDASHDILLIHQKHSYSHFQAESEELLRQQDMFRHEEIERNFSLLGGWSRIFGAAEATHRLVRGDIVKGNQWPFWCKEQWVRRREQRN